MNGIALCIVLVAALLHASWNYLLKKSKRKIAFIWCCILIALVFYFPVLLYFWPEVPISEVGWICIVATGILHALYFWFMGGAYERGDLSLVYPVFRGLGPLFVPLLAVMLLHERLTFPGILGICLVVFGIYVIHLRSFSLSSFFEPILALRGGAFIWALCTGGTVAIYSLVDKVGASAVYPPVYIYLMFALSWLLLSPYVLRRERIPLRAEWKTNKKNIVVVGFLCLFTYLMILFAMRMSKVSYVVAVREISIVFSAAFGVLWLNEKHVYQKLAGSVIITIGVIMIGSSR